MLILNVATWLIFLVLIMFVNFSWQNTITLEKGNNSLNSYKLSNIINTFRNNFVTIDNNYSSLA